MCDAFFSRENTTKKLHLQIRAKKQESMFIKFNQESLTFSSDVVYPPSVIVDKERLLRNKLSDKHYEVAIVIASGVVWNWYGWFSPISPII
jgi:hypothetical protein